MMGMRKCRARIAHKASAYLLAIFLAAVLVTGCGGEKLDAVQARMGQLLAEQSQLRQFLEVDFYGIGEDVNIWAPLPSDYSSFPDQVSLRNGKLEIPAGVSDKVRAALTRYEPQIVAVFKEFGCRGLVLASNPHQIQMDFDAVNIGGSLGTQSLGYPSGTGPLSGRWPPLRSLRD